MSEDLVATILHITPGPDELLNGVQLKCEIDGCPSVFRNSGNLQMHLEKHHKISTEYITKTVKLFFCPQIDCVYYDGPANKKNFKCLKFLKQHFQKVHAEKKFMCMKCNKAFGTNAMRETHERHCGKEYVCLECGWKYDTLGTLQTHAKRRKHIITKYNEEKVAIPKLNQELNKIDVPKLKDSQTQTDIEIDTPRVVLPPKKRIKLETFIPEISMFPENPLCNTETQTELKMISGTNDPMLYSDMHTQTCDAFLSELGLTDIQTQTNWPGSDDDNDQGVHNQFSTVAHDDLMVSTETQTNFTQSLLNSCNEISLTGSMTQYTQTCDTLLEGLFGGEDTDFISNFQSTYTQT